MNGIKKVFKLKIAIKLMNMGYTVLFTEPNLKNNKLKVFCFIDSVDLEIDFAKALKELEEEENKKAI